MLTFALATNPLLAFAGELPTTENLRGGGGHSEPLGVWDEPQYTISAGENADANKDGEGVESTAPSTPGETAQIIQQVALDQQPSSNNQGEQPDAGSATMPNQAGTTGAPSTDQVAGTVPLPSGSAEGITSIVSDNLVFEINTQANTATLVGSATTAPKGDLSIPASVTSGATTYEVTTIAKSVFANCQELTSLSLPATLREVDPDALTGCSSLKSISVSSKNDTFASSDGMLFTKDYSTLLLIPEGKEGAAIIPGETSSVPAQAFSRCLGMPSLRTGDGGAELKAYNGMLFTKDLKTLLVRPAGAGSAVVLPAETEAIGEYALAGCKNLASITALGKVQTIDPTAFADETKATAVVALPAGEDYEVRKAIWERASFQHFAEPAQPGATTHPEPNDAEATTSGLTFTLLDDYTLSVAWEGTTDPDATLEIPASAEINGVTYQVSTIAPNAFTNRASLTTVKLPASVTSLGEAAFAGCASLTSVDLPDTLQVIGSRAFEATALTEIWLPANIATIGPRAFAVCESLTRIVARNTPEVADDALAACANLSIYCPYNESGTYPWNLGLLANNNHLMPYGLSLPEEPLVLEVGQQANLFENALYEVPEGCEVSYSYAAKPLSIENGVVTAKSKGTSEVKAALILDGTELVYSTHTIEVISAQTNVSTLSSRVLSNSVLAQTINNDISLFAVGDQFTSGGNITYEITSDTTSAKTVKLIKCNRSATGRLIIPEKVGGYSVTAIGKSAFYSCSSLTAITIPSSVTAIEDSAFQGCSDLTGMTIPHSVTTIGDSVFYGCDNIVSFSVNESSDCFSSDGIALYNKGKTELICYPTGRRNSTFIIPDSVKTIKNYAFNRCQKLNRVTFGSGITSLPAYTFYLCTYLADLYVKGNITSIDNNAFSDTPMSSVKVYLSDDANKTVWTDVGIPASNFVISPKLIFDAQNGSPTPSTQSVFAGQLASEPVAIPQRTGYTFDGWYTSIAGSIKWNFTTDLMPDSNTTLYAHWTTVPYDITYNLANGTATGNNPTTYTIETNTFTLSNPSREGYTFKGWTGSNGTTPQTTVSVNKGSTGVKTYTANWDPISYDITYSLGGGSANNPSSYTIETSTFTLSVPSRTGYAFKGWTGSNGSTPQKTVTVSKGSTGVKNYTANWDLISYDISYSLANGTATGNNPTTYTIETSTFTLSNPNRTGYTFTGWTGSNGSTPQKTVTVTKGSHGIKNYTANWSANTYTVTFSKDGGSEGDNSKLVTYGSSMPRITAPTKTGYTFLGYYDKQTNGTKYYNADGTSACNWNKTSSVPLYAHWSLNTYQITFDNDSGLGGPSSPMDVNYDAALPKVAKPTRTGFVFGGYYDAATGTRQYYDKNGESKDSMPADNLALRAKWFALEQDDGVFVYTYLSDATLEVRAKNPSTITTADIPETFRFEPEGDLPISRVRAEGFKDCTKLTSVSIPSSVKSIEASGFEGCSGLTEVTLPSSVTSLGASAFKGCSSLGSVVVPDSVTSLGASAFEGCSKLGSVTFGAGVTALPARVMASCVMLSSVEAKGNVATVATDAFEGVDSSRVSVALTDGSITTSTLGNRKNPWWQLGLTQVSPYLLSFNSQGGSVVASQLAFVNKTVTAPEAPTLAGSIFGGWFDDAEFKSRWNFETDVMPPSNKTLYAKWVPEGEAEEVDGDLVYRMRPDGTLEVKAKDVASIVSANIASEHTFAGLGPYPVTAVAADGFKGATNLASVTFKGDNLTTITTSAFEGCTSLAQVRIPASVTAVEASAFSGCTALAGVVFEEGSQLTTIDARAFESCAFEKIALPKKLATIGESAFTSCTALSEISLPDSVTSLGQGAFSGCVGLTSLALGAGITTIPANAFNASLNLFSISSTGKVTSIDKNMPFISSIKAKAEVTLGPTDYENHRAVWTGAGFENVVKAGTYTLSFDLNGAPGEVPPSQDIKAGEKATAFADPTWDSSGSTFAGWYEDTDYSLRWDFETSTMPAHDVTLHAKWEAPALMSVTAPINPCVVVELGGEVKPSTDTYFQSTGKIGARVSQVSCEVAEGADTLFPKGDATKVGVTVEEIADPANSFSVKPGGALAFVKGSKPDFSLKGRASQVDSVSTIPVSVGLSIPEGTTMAPDTEAPFARLVFTFEPLES